MTRARWSRRLVGLALLILLSAHVTAMGPDLKRNGWIQLVPSTLLVLQPMNVGEWIEAQWNRNSKAVTPPVLYRELGQPVVVAGVDPLQARRIGLSRTR